MYNQIDFNNNKNDNNYISLNIKDTLNQSQELDLQVNQHQQQQNNQNYNNNDQYQINSNFNTSFFNNCNDEPLMQICNDNRQYQQQLQNTSLNLQANFGDENNEIGTINRQEDNNDNSFYITNDLWKDEENNQDQIQNQQQKQQEYQQQDAIQQFYGQSFYDFKEKQILLQKDEGISRFQNKYNQQQKTNYMQEKVQENVQNFEKYTKIFKEKIREQKKNVYKNQQVKKISQQQQVNQQDFESISQNQRNIDKNNNNQGRKRVKERKIQEVIKFVQQYKMLKRDGVPFEKLNCCQKLTQEQCAQRVGVSKKTLDDYMSQLEKADKNGFDFQNNKNGMFGMVRQFNRQFQKK
ncbi:hypothetical protein PPERSA_11065 [Pseudocohnilembus persalinus]|uniref:Uncharacterized protein n=1 Tax=Pseudocohnilembus persalinus TaxID=266149 RepID=A0A0V0QYX4_PSEPJ|nr:hypothetical protein PPERSA_11065 [Pseudocohnilembus persalinus]|eukprot:KRX07516.1 hypothetical protein PPERSA_11065 [Pseudocohnilembus persalinus]